MEREAALLVISLALCGPLCFVFGALARPLARFASSGRRAESLAWRRLWLPLVPAAFALLLLLGWAAQEPDDTNDGVAVILMLVALPGAFILARAIARAATSTLGRRAPLAATVGLLHPHVIIDDTLATALDPEALEAVRAHERAHARHRDPLQIWLAQLAADLQWPAPSARIRFRQWLHALEVARDEEARDAGAEGDALASAIVTVAQLAQENTAACAALIGQGEMLQDRIARLLSPVVPDRERTALGWTMSIAALFVSGFVLGALGGDQLLRCIPGVTS